MLTITIALVALMFVFEFSLDLLNYKHRNQPIPDNVADVYDKAAYKKWHLYTMENFRVNLYSKVINVVVLILMSSLGVFPKIATLTKSISSSKVFEPIIFVAIYMAINYVINIGFDIYKTFHIEEKYGFNKTTRKTFILDQIKNIILIGSLGFGILSFIYNMYLSLGNVALIYTWFMIMAVLFLINILYTKVFIKLFNKLTPLPQGDALYVKTKILANDLGYEIKTISVMDASKRSTKLNAFFSGFGRFKSVVLYDTLVEKCDTDQVVSVLAHEIGHAKHKDTLKNTGFLGIQLAIFLGILSVILSTTRFFIDFGFTEVHLGFAIILFLIILKPVMAILTVADSALSRRAEYKADALAADAGYGEAMIGALKILSRENFSNLTPHPLMVKMTYSHPTTSQRIQALTDRRVK